ncbi:hypothetical protein [Litchfieldia alkalitelluris]|uniref:hypothetical protein n=1 Tax=Litchfieldia alkalitelluris TaxID=304268 RepID=UPI0009985EFA|nr:hypothetical protein [Litchfieldia alkalitelluris]
MKFEIKGLDSLEKQLKNIEKQVKKELDGEVRLVAIFNDDFMKRNTKFSSFEEFHSQSPYQITEETRDLQSLVNKELDLFVNKNTNFSNWVKFFEEAGQEYAANKLKKAFK